MLKYRKYSYTCYRLISAIIIVASIQITFVCVFFGPINSSLFFTPKKAYAFSFMSEKLLADKNKGCHMRLIQTDSTSSRKEEENPLDGDIIVFMKKNNILQCQIDYQDNTVSWCFLGYYRVFANYVYCQPSNATITADRVVSTENLGRHIRENWWLNVY